MRTLRDRRWGWAAVLLGIFACAETNSASPGVDDGEAASADRSSAARVFVTQASADGVAEPADATPRDVPVPEPMDVPPPTPRDVPPPNPDKPEVDPKPRPIP